MVPLRHGTGNGSLCEGSGVDGRDEVATEELLSRAGGSTVWKLVAGAAHRLSQFVCARSGRVGREEGGRRKESGLEALLRSDVFASGLATLLSPVELSRLALACRTGAQVTSDASVWWSVCVLRYRFGNAMRHRQEVAMLACCRSAFTEGDEQETCNHAAANQVALCRAWRIVAAALWWYTDEHSPVEDVLSRMATNGACSVSVPVGFQGVKRPWRELERQAKDTAVWQREYRAISSLLHSITFLFPILAQSQAHPATQAHQGNQAQAQQAPTELEALTKAATKPRRSAFVTNLLPPHPAHGVRFESDQAHPSPNLRPLVLRGGMQVWEHLVPSVSGIQVLLESAWAEGFDEAGAAYFGGGRLLGKTIPIGATECAVILRYLGFRAVLMDLTSPCPSTGVHTSLMELCRWWFLSIHSCRFPLYLQYGTSDEEPGGSLLVLGVYRSAASILRDGAAESQRPAYDGSGHHTGSQDTGSGHSHDAVRQWDRPQCLCCRWSHTTARTLPFGSAGTSDTSHMGVWESGTHEEWDTLVVLNPDSAPTRASVFPPPHMLRTPGALVPRGDECVHSLSVHALDWPMAQVVGCGVGQRPVQLAPNERAEWKDLATGHYRIPPDPREWDPLSLFNIK